MNRVGVFISCRNRLLGESIARIFAKRPNFEVCLVLPAEKFPGERCANFGDGVVLFDSVPEFLSRRPELSAHTAGAVPKPVLVAMEDDKKQFLSAIRHGAFGYILRDASALDVIAGVQSVASGESVCPPQMLRFLFEFVAHQTGKARLSRGEPDLTRRERELVPLIGRGMTNKEIAALLNLSEETIKSHVHRMLRKVGAGDRRGILNACQIADGEFEN